MAFAAALPLLTAAAPSLISTFGGGSGKPAGGGAGGGAPLEQTSRQDVSVFVDNVNNVIGAPVNINFGGNQSADGSLSGQRFLDRGVDTPLIQDAPFGALQSVQALDGAIPVSFSDLFSPTAQPKSKNVMVLIGAGLVVAGAGFALIKKR